MFSYFSFTGAAFRVKNWRQFESQRQTVLHELFFVVNRDVCEAIDQYTHHTNLISLYVISPTSQ